MDCQEYFAGQIFASPITIRAIDSLAGTVRGTPTHIPFVTSDDALVKRGSDGGGARHCEANAFDPS